MCGYTQLPREQRYQIQALLKRNPTQLQIATVIGFHKAMSVASFGGTVVAWSIGRIKPMAWIRRDKWRSARHDSL